MRLLVVSSYYKPAYVYGGPVRSLAMLCAGLSRAGADVTVFTTDAGRDQRLAVPLLQPVDVDGAQITYFPLRGNGRGFFYARDMARPLGQTVASFDIVLVNAMWGYPMHLAVRACRRHNVPYVVQLRGQLLPWAVKRKRLKKDFYYRLVLRGQLNGAAALHCTDESEAQAAKRLALTPPAFVVPNPIDAAAFDAALPPGRFRAELGISAASILLLFLGRLAHIKRPDIAIATLKEVRQAGHDAHLVIAGPDEEGLAPALRDQAELCGCASFVHLTGLLDEGAARAALRDADLLLMPTEVQENFGMAAVEALAAGVPVLTSPGVPAGLRAGQAGAGCVAAGTGAEFGSVACQMLSDRTTMRAMGESGRRLVRGEYDIQRVAERVLAEFAAIKATGRPLGVA